MAEDRHEQRADHEADGERDWIHVFLLGGVNDMTDLLVIVADTFPYVVHHAWVSSQAPPPQAISFTRSVMSSFSTTPRVSTGAKSRTISR